MMRVLRMATLGLALFSVTVAAFAQSGGQTPAPARWDEDVVDLFASLPLQDGGRVKPLDTFARVELLKFSAKRKCLDHYGNNLSVFGRMMDAMVYKKGVRLSPVEWLLDCLFYPERAREYPVFLVEDAAVIDAIGLSQDGHKRRDRYSFAELEPATDKLMALANQYMSIPQAEQTPVQSQLVNLATNLVEFDRITSYLDFARRTYPIEGSGLADLVTENRFSAILAQGQVLRQVLAFLEHGLDGLKSTLSPEDFERLRAMLPEGMESMDDAARKEELEALRRLLQVLQDAGARAQTLALFPPSVPVEEKEEWSTPQDLIQPAFMSSEPLDGQLAMLAMLEDLTRLRGDPAAFKTKLAEFHRASAGLAEARGEYAKVPLEVKYYKLRFFHRSQWLYVACFVLVALLWLRPGSKALNLLAPTALLVPTGLLVAGLVYRCVIRDRPPVTNLYETILFATAVAVAVAIALEYMNRQRIAVSVGVVLGLVGLFVANKYEISDGSDTMPSMVAVLDTNFWLSVHVTTIIMGYAASLLAGAIAHVYIFGRLVAFRGRGAAFFSSVARMTYGVICFAMLFSVVGTVFGGIWANESWGRFWGWDPKENGALMIVLWQLIILHARWGGYFKDLGVNVAAVFLSMIIGFSWWGVNLLGVGLHSYGWAGGIAQTLNTFYVVEGVVILLGAMVWLKEFSGRARPAAG